MDDSRPALICIQETKLSRVSERDVISFLGRDYTNFVYLPALAEPRGGEAGLRPHLGPKGFLKLK